MHAAHATDGDPIVNGRIYIAPPDHHLLGREGQVRVLRGPRENRHRPAADPLFRSAAYTYGPRVVGVVLTGSLDDGTVGLKAIKACGGVAVVQDPKEAVFPGMPFSAMTNVDVDYSCALKEIPDLLKQLANEPVSEGTYQMSKELEIEVKVAEMDESGLENIDKLGKPSAYGCPECHGVLYEIHDGDLFRFRCRVGHAYSAESMMAEHGESLEGALWIALRTLEENASLARRLAAQAQALNQRVAATTYEQKAQQDEREAEVIKQMLLSNAKPPDD